MNDIRCSRNLMRKQIGPELTKAVKKRYNEIKAHSCFSKLQQGPGKIVIIKGVIDYHGTGNRRNWLIP